MLYSSALAAFAALTITPLSSAAAIYSKSSPVLQIDGKDFDKLVKNSDKSSIVEFYAPWCGHCQNLKPAYEKAAQSLEGLAQVVAVNCDVEENKPFCGRMGVKGFPTLKTVRATGKIGKPIIMDYNGPRTASAIVEAVKKLITNNVKRLEDKELDEWLKGNNETAKAILFSEKATPSALIKVLANDFLYNLHVAQVQKKEGTANQMFGITKYPTLVVLPGGDEPAVTYDGEMKKPAMSGFLSKYAQPRDMTAKQVKNKVEKKEAKEENDKKVSSESSTFAEASASQASQEGTEGAASAKTVTLEDTEPLESPDPIADKEAPTPVPVPEVPSMIPMLETIEDLQAHCLGPKTPTCVLALLPPKVEPNAELPSDSTEALSSLSALSEKHKARGSHLFPFFAVPSTNPGTGNIRAALGLGVEETRLIAVNGKRAWWREYGSDKGFDSVAVEGWVDGIRFGEGKKQKLPEELVVAKKGEATEDDLVKEKLAEEAPAEELLEEATEGAEEKPPIIHEEL